MESIFEGRPRWLNAVMLFCAYMTFIYTPWDFFMKPVAEDQEVWFGFVLTGMAAKLTEPIHELIYAVLLYGIWKMRPWMGVVGTAYLVQVTISMVVWNFVDPRGNMVFAVVWGAVFAGLTLAFWRARGVFTETPARM